MSVFVLLPTYNERENLASLVGEILQVLPGCRVLVIDDNSPDGTGEIADGLKAGNSGRVEVLHRLAKDGLGRAYLAGFDFALQAGADKIIQMDADHSHPPALLPHLIHCCETYDLALGSRYISNGGTAGWPLRRKALSWGANLYARSLLGLSVKDVTTGFRCFHRRVLASLDLSQITSRGYGFQVEMVYRTLSAGFSVGEVPFIFKDRIAGRSKMGLGIAYEGALTVLKLKFGLASRDLPGAILGASKIRNQD